MAPVATYSLLVAPSDWPAVEGMVRSFANQHGWLIDGQVSQDADFRWFQFSLCVEPGTNFLIMQQAFGPGLSILVFQPQGGTSWQPPLRDLLSRISERWPGRVVRDRVEADPSSADPKASLDESGEPVLPDAHPPLATPRTPAYLADP